MKEICKVTNLECSECQPVCDSKIEDVAEKTIQERQLEIINHYGFDNQLERLVEECGELVQAIMKSKRYDKSGITKYDNVIEEIADVKNIIKQMELYWPYVKEGIAAITEYKVDRELDRIESGKKGDAIAEMEKEIL